MRRTVVAVLLLLMWTSGAAAQDFRDSVARASVRAAGEYAQATPPDEGRISRKLLWTSIGLLASGGVALARGFAADPEDQTCVVGSDVGYTCVSNRKVGLTVGGALVGAGGAVLAIGVARSHRSSPSIAVRPGGFEVRGELPLDQFRRLGRHLRRLPVAAHLASRTSPKTD